MMFGPIIKQSRWIISPLVAIISAIHSSNNTFVSSLQIPCSLGGELRSRVSGRTTTFAVACRPHDTLPTKKQQLVDLGVKTTAAIRDDDDSSLLIGSHNNMPKAAAVTSILLFPLSSAASTLSDQLYNPDNFKPVCAASDSFYRLLQGTTQALVGTDNFVEYGPLISGGLLRGLYSSSSITIVRTLTFTRAEANGVGWILPIHETVETFLAGFIFAVATTFILVGSTKLLAVLVFYGDLLVGVPCRLLGGFAFDRALGKPVTLDIGIGPWKKQFIGPAITDSQDIVDEKQIDMGSNIQVKQYPALALSGAVKAVGEISKVTREFVEGADFFVGRYLTILASGYIAIKFLHFKVFPDFPPFL